MDKTVGFIDVGTNSVHMLVVRFYDSAMGVPLYQDKESVRLGRSLFSLGRIDDETKDKLSKVFASFSSVARRFGASEVRACATCAAREMPDHDFMERIAVENGVDLRIISGPEEARLTRLGILGPVSPRRTLLIDIGGGSTEVVIADGERDLLTESLRVGALRLAFGTNIDQSGPVSPRKYDALLQYVDREANAVSGRVKDIGFETAIGSSGTFLALASAIAARRGDGDDSYFTYPELVSFMQALCRLDVAGRSGSFKLSGSRADIIIGGGAVAEELMFRLGISRIEISSNGLREGMRVDYLIRNGWKTGSVRESSVISLAGRFAIDRLHADTVRRLSSDLFDRFSIAGLITPDPVIRELIGYAGMLAEVGSIAGRKSRSALTTLIIRNSAMLGFEPDELDLVAFFARYSRGQIPLPGSKVYTFTYDPMYLARCTMVLKLADVADRCRDGKVDHISVSQHQDAVQLTISSSSDVSMAVWKMIGLSDEFSRLFGKSLLVSVMELQQ